MAFVKGCFYESNLNEVGDKTLRIIVIVAIY
ncbi:hypothetical protein C8N26_0854 [Tenacibaculum lutimaris]|uniref:Uncharacterized protein n=1 Tax=Tenacibaculum lutimaris TaxID=285258 RepID=A0A420E275_9FLAO|nr:hypothetical protein C8N26_0854 [Tenacibaculum lutimaris]